MSISAKRSHTDVYTVISPYVSVRGLKMMVLSHGACSSTYLQPILQQASTILGEGSKAVIDTNDQYEVCLFLSIGAYHSV